MTEAPELFQVDDAGNVTVLQENPPLDLLEKARQAEKYCPTKAIKIESQWTNCRFIVVGHAVGDYPRGFCFLHARPCVDGVD